MAVAIKKILYAADAKESSLEEAQDYINQCADSGETEDGQEDWALTNQICWKWSKPGCILIMNGKRQWGTLNVPLKVKLWHSSPFQMC